MSDIRTSPISPRMSQLQAQRRANIKAQILIEEGLRSAKLNQTEIANMTGISRRTLTRILNNQSDVTVKDLAGMLDRMGYSLEIRAIEKKV